MLRLHLTFVALLLGSAASYANNNCEPIRTQIDARVRASGVTDFVLSVVEADARVIGKVVGSCDLGTKKIVYNQPSPSSSSSSARPKAKPTEEPILTECKDGSVTVGGDCKK
jgi:hypothetical protein